MSISDWDSAPKPDRLEMMAFDDLEMERLYHERSTALDEIYKKADGENGVSAEVVSSMILQWMMLNN